MFGRSVFVYWKFKGYFCFMVVNFEFYLGFLVFFRENVYESICVFFFLRRRKKMDVGGLF